jgi:hypothetical protein
MSTNFKIALREGSALSQSFANTRNCYKVVETDHVFAHIVLGYNNGTAIVRPLYRADIHVRVGKIWHVMTSYEHGDPLNVASHYEDLEGSALAAVAWRAISALDERALRAARAKRQSPKRRQKGKTR